MSNYFRLALRFLCTVVRSQLDVAPEDFALHQQLTVLTRSSGRPRMTLADRLFWSWLSRRWSPRRSALVLIRPETVVRWHRRSWRRS